MKILQILPTVFAIAILFAFFGNGHADLIEAAVPSTPLPAVLEPVGGSVDSALQAPTFSPKPATASTPTPGSKANPSHANATNLALGKPAYASSSENGSLGPNNAFDGNMSTRWGSVFSDPQWIYVDLGAVYSIQQIWLYWEAAFGREYLIEFSNDAVTWQTIYHETNGNGGIDALTISGTGRYVRMTGISRGTGWGYSLLEFEVYDSILPTPTPTPTPSPTSTLPPPGVLLFSDDFNDGDYNGWQVLNGIWFVTNGTLGSHFTTCGGNASQIVAGDSGWTDYEFTFDLERISGWDDGGILLRYSQNATFSLAVHPSQPYGGGITLGKTNFGTVASRSWPFQPMQWYRLKVRLYKEQIEVWLVEQTGETLLINYSDTDPKIVQGKIGFDMWAGALCDSEVHFDNIQVKSLADTRYSISGRVTDDSGNGAASVTISSSSGSNATTDASGYYTLTNVITGTYTITPTKSGYIFAPITRTASVPPDATGKDFRIRTVPNPFLDLPIAYGNFSQSANGNLDGKGPGRVNSWFDHFYPNYINNQNLFRWDGSVFIGAAYTNAKTCETGNSCYDGHNGIDFQENIPNESVYPAATGTVKEVNRNWPQSIGARGSSYGNYVLLDHGNGYATFYAHLLQVNTAISVGTQITTTRAITIGVMGGTGGWPVHLHFGLYYDANGNGLWEENYQGYSEAIDPYGWMPFGYGFGVDPWNIQSRYLWQFPLQVQQSAGTSGANLTSPSGNTNTIIPPGALTTTLTIQLGDTSPVAAPSAQLRSSGGSFWLRVLEWLTGSGNSPTTRKPTATLSFAQPVTVIVIYGITETQHLNTSQLVINRWDENSGTWLALPTTIDNNLKTATAQTTEIGNFDLQGSLLCPADTLEIDDNYYAANIIATDGTRENHLFDIAQDEDWHKFNAIAGMKYVVQTSNLASGVDIIVQVYDIDGVDVLATDDNSGGGKASRLVWQALMDGTYFVRVSRAPSSTFGCNATYQVSVTQQNPLFLPLILR